jgi:hypothetical protein
VHQPAPRFHATRGCSGNTAQVGAQQDPVVYPFPSADGSGAFQRLVTGERSFDVNQDGVANVGLMPDFVEDLRRIGLGAAELEPLFRSAEGYVRMWERALDAADDDGDGVPNGADLCRYQPDPGQADSGGVGGSGAGDGIGDACQCGSSDGDGAVTIADVARVRRALADLPPPLPAPERCNVSGAVDASDGPDADALRDDCSADDVAALRAALAGAATPSLQVCAPALP